MATNEKDVVYNGSVRFYTDEVFFEGGISTATISPLTVGGMVTVEGPLTVTGATTLDGGVTFEGNLNVQNIECVSVIASDYLRSLNGIQCEAGLGLFEGGMNISNGLGVTGGTSTNTLIISGASTNTSPTTLASYSGTTVAKTPCANLFPFSVTGYDSLHIDSTSLLP